MYRQTVEGANVRHVINDEVEKVRHAQTDEEENVRHVKKTKGRMSAYALFDEGENVRSGKCPVTDITEKEKSIIFAFTQIIKTRK